MSDELGEEGVLDLKNKIGSDSFAKLKTRANKVGSSSYFLPEEYSNNLTLKSHIAKIITFLRLEKLDIERVIFVATIRILETNKEIIKSRDGKIFDLSSYSFWARKSVKQVIYQWLSSFDILDDEVKYSKIYKLIVPHNEDDFLGLLYQSIFSEGGKSEQGSYYTPSNIVNDSLSNFEKPIEKFLDPCCGSGKYLILAARKFKLMPENIFGFDCDKIAINIARINLLLEYKDEEFTPNVYCMDSLSELATGEMFCETNNLIGKIDAIATNPPWGAYKNSISKIQNSRKIKSGETFSLFLEKSIQLLCSSGQLSFILPESILKIKVHSDIRELILSETKILNISMLGRQFTGVFTPIIRIDLQKEFAPENWLVSLKNGNKLDKITQERFRKNDSFNIDVSTESHEEELLKKMYSIEHLTLYKNAEWALGIVTGDNKKYLLDVLTEGAEAVFRGSDVFQYFLGNPKSFLQFNPDVFQQVAPKRFFRAPEKLIYKFISKSLVFAYDDLQKLTLNSANILIPHIPEMSIKVVLAFLNSLVFQYIFKKKFSTHKVLRGDLEKLPFPKIDIQIKNSIELLVNKAISSNTASQELEEIIYEIFKLSENDINLIRNTVGE